MNTSRIITVLVVVMMSMASNCHALSWSLGYGNGPGELKIFNKKTAPDKFREDAPLGPCSFRVVDNELWLLNSVGTELYKFAPDGSLLYSLKLPELDGYSLYSDFGFVFDSDGLPEYVWVANDGDSVVRKVSLKTGEIPLSIGGQGSEPGKFIQIDQLETDVVGRVYISDIAKKSISVFSSYGELLREIPYQPGRFALDYKGRIHLLYYSDSAGYFRKTYSPKGQLVKSVHLGLRELTDSRVEHVDKSGNMYVTFRLHEKFEGKVRLYMIDEDGVVKKQTSMAVPRNMGRYFSVDSHGVMVASDADYLEAPDSVFEVKTVEWESAEK